MTKHEHITAAAKLTVSYLVAGAEDTKSRSASFSWCGVPWDDSCIQRDFKDSFFPNVPFVSASEACGFYRCKALVYWDYGIKQRA